MAVRNHRKKESQGLGMYSGSGVARSVRMETLWFEMRKLGGAFGTGSSLLSGRAGKVILDGMTS